MRYEAFRRPVTMPWPHGRIWLLALVVFLSACATRPFEGNEVAAASFLDRVMVQERNGLVVSASVPTAEETLALTGLDLYAQGIQPVWIKVENTSDVRARIITWSIDRDYFSPIEVAYMNRKRFSKEGYAAMERWFRDNGLARQVPPGESRSGLVFTNLRPGTKGFNLTLGHAGTAVDLTFFLPLPGFVPDFMEVDFDNLYSADEMRDLSRDELGEALKSELPCCSSNPLFLILLLFF